MIKKKKNKIGSRTKAQRDFESMLKHYEPSILPIPLIVMQYEDCEIITEMFDIDGIDDIYSLPEFDAMTFLGTTKDGHNNRFVVCAFYGVPNLRIMVHEASHAATMYCVAHDIPFGMESDEIHAYLTDWVFTKVYETFNDKNK